MNYFFRYHTFFAVLTLLLSFDVRSEEVMRYQDWNVTRGVDSVEAHTISKSGNATFGFFCKDESCVYYINVNASCPVNAKNPVLMSAGGVASAFMATCTKLNEHYFQLLDDPLVVNKAINFGKNIGFSMALQDGNFFVATFSLDNARLAIERAILESREKSARLIMGLRVN